MVAEVCVGYGQRHSFSWQAFRQWTFERQDATYEDAKSFDTALAMVIDGEASYAVIPLRNSTIGHVEESMHAVDKCRERLEIVALVELPIVHSLVGAKGSTLTTIRTVVSFPAALAQCRNRIAQMGLEVRSHRETAGAVLEVATSNDLGTGAIGPASAVDGTDGVILVESMNDQPNNITTFAIFRRSNG